MSGPRRALIKGVVIAVVIILTLSLFDETIQVPLEIARNWKGILTGEYAIPTISAETFYGYIGCLTAIVLVMTVIPSKTDKEE